MSPSLPIDLDRSSAQPLYRQIERWIRHAIDGGRLPPGTRLPGVRTLARDLGVSVVPVITAYEQLGADGYLVSQVGLGTMVAPDPPRPVQRPGVAATAEAHARSRGAGLPATNRWVPDGPPRSKGSREPPTDGDLARRLARSWSRHLHRARLLTEAIGPEAAHQADDLGLVWLRTMLAVRAGLHRADAPGADQCIVTAGVQAAIAAVARTWLGPDRTCAVASGYPTAARRAFEATGARLFDLDTAAGPRALGPPVERADLVVVAPALAGLAATPLDLAGRRRLMDWAARVGAIVVEDDRERDVAADRLPTLGSLDLDGRVIGVGGIPAEIAPGAALGYLVVPSELHGPVAAMVLAGGQAPGLVEQEALASMLESGDFERDLRRLREARGQRLVVERTTAEQGDGAVRVRSGTSSCWGSGQGLRLRNRP
ncbi:MAG TPA: PLP-dependent aminotransferase family protein [Candidatus Saccharimonadales bacterium]|nr:PLP-dependent aminotransferase family protein [Candidatus Saccharimonadales bacterium]